MMDKQEAAKLLGKKSWEVQTEGKTKEEIKKMMSEKGKKGAEKRWKKKEDKV